MTWNLFYLVYFFSLSFFFSLSTIFFILLSVSPFSTHLNALFRFYFITFYDSLVVLTFHFILFNLSSPFFEFLNFKNALFVFLNLPDMLSTILSRPQLWFHLSHLIISFILIFFIFPHYFDFNSPFLFLYLHFSNCYSFLFFLLRYSSTFFLIILPFFFLFCSCSTFN